MTETGTEPQRSDTAASLNDVQYHEPSSTLPEESDSSITHEQEAIDAQPASLDTSENQSSLVVHINIGYLAQRDRIRRMNESLRHER